MVKYIRKIAQEYVSEENIRWLVIQPHIHNNAVIGYYMYLHKDLNEHAMWDNWYQSLEIAFEAGEAYGLKKPDWKILNSN